MINLLLLAYCCKLCFTMPQRSYLFSVLYENHCWPDAHHWPAYRHSEVKQQTCWDDITHRTEQSSDYCDTNNLLQYILSKNIGKHKCWHSAVARDWAHQRVSCTGVGRETTGSAWWLISSRSIVAFRTSKGLKATKWLLRVAIHILLRSRAPTRAYLALEQSLSWLHHKQHTCVIVAATLLVTPRLNHIFLIS